MDYWITFTLKSDATFGKGEGVAGFIDQEVEHDRYGLPFLRGRTLKGLLSEEADNLLFAMSNMATSSRQSRWTAARQVLFGRPSSQSGSAALVRYGNAQLPVALRETIGQTLKQPGNTLTRSAILSSLTALRRQTAIDDDGLPLDTSLRTTRVILRKTPFFALLQSKRPLEKQEVAFLAATVLAFRRAGTGRNRGLGMLEADLLDESQHSILKSSYDFFVEEALS